MEPSSRTPEGEPNRCPVCGKRLRIEPSRPPGDAPCPHCGHLIWFGPRTHGKKTTEEAYPEKESVMETLFGQFRRAPKGLTQRLFEYLRK